MRELDQRIRAGLNELLDWRALQELERLFPSASDLTLYEAKSKDYWSIMEGFGQDRSDAIIEDADSLDNLRKIFMLLAESLEDDPHAELIYSYADWAQRKAVAVRRILDFRF